MKLLCLLLFMFLSQPVEARLIDKTIAQVNASIVLLSDIQNYKNTYSLRQEVDPFASLAGPLPNTQKDILNYLIQEQIILQKFPATDADIEEEISAVQKNNRIDRDHLKEILRSQGVKFDDYKRLMGVSVSKRKLIERELRPLAAVSDEEVKNFYYTDASMSTKRSSSKLVLSYTLQQMIIPDAQLVDLISKRLNAGEDFEAVASDLAGRGVELAKLGTLSEENMNGKILSAIQGLKVGENTKPVSTGAGYLILKIIAVSAPQDPVFEREKETVRGRLFQAALKNQLRLWTDRERSSSYVHIP